MTRSELADRLGKSKGHITQILDGTANLTLRTVSDVFFALGCEFHPSQVRLKDDESDEVFQTQFHFNITDFNAGTEVTSLCRNDERAVVDMPSGLLNVGV
ncbi:helix-turn-helix transcriptional regulator [Planctellipticum variicoloris]|nr:helix-turn-helix transcriptional regulator [Planctomycetaceae bacterium SH412]